MPRLSAVNPLVYEAAHIRPERRAQGIEDALKQNPLPVGETLPKGGPDAQGDELHGPVKRNGEAVALQEAPRQHAGEHIARAVKQPRMRRAHARIHLPRAAVAGDIADHVRLRDIVLGQAACTDSIYAAQYGLSGTFAPIASYALLTLMMAQVCDLRPGDFVHTLGDTHLYLNHMEQVAEQLSRTPRKLPSMRLNPAVRSIFDFHYEDFTLEGYDPWPAIKAPMSF